MISISFVMGKGAGAARPVIVVLCYCVTESFFLLAVIAYTIGIQQFL